jgi:hypothetical protein
MSYRESPDLERLPPLQLNGPAGVVRLDAPELGAPVLLLVRDGAIERARPYIAALEERLRDLRDWGGRPLLVTERNIVDSRLPSAVASPEAWDALGVENSALVIADRWRVVYFARGTTTFADLPAADDVVDWVRYLGTQCPECGVIDEPGHGEWAI